MVQFSQKDTFTCSSKLLAVFHIWWKWVCTHLVYENKQTCIFISSLRIHLPSWTPILLLEDFNSRDTRSPLLLINFWTSTFVNVSVGCPLIVEIKSPSRAPHFAALLPGFTYIIESVFKKNCNKESAQQLYFYACIHQRQANFASRW